MMREQESQDVARVREACEKLQEHFDSVQIFCTRHESGELEGTVNIQLGLGNWFARYGQVVHWMSEQDQDSRNKTTDGNL